MVEECLNFHKLMFEKVNVNRNMFECKQKHVLQ